MEQLTAEIECSVLHTLRRTLARLGVEAEVVMDAGLRTGYWHTWGLRLPDCRARVHASPQGYEWFHRTSGELLYWPYEHPGCAAVVIATRLYV